MFIKSIPHWIQKLMKRYTWQMPEDLEKPTVYLTFDDGPHASITPWVLDQLNAFEAKATFFCIGKNVVENPAVYDRILKEGHSVGNHTHNHIKGRVMGLEPYLDDVEKAREHIDSQLFRPPYGSLKLAQAKALEQLGYKIILWSIIPGDWEAKISPENCLDNIISNIKPGSIIVLHDSEKAQRNIQFVLPLVLEFCKQKGWNCANLPGY